MTERAAIYLRLSEMTDSTTSPARQQATCREFVAAKGWQHDEQNDAFQDWDRSAYSGRSRPDFERLLTRVAAGAYDRLVVYRLDRLSRSFAHWGRIFKACQDGGVVIHSATEGIDSQSAAPVFGVLAGLAWSESSTISARVRAARAAQFATGRWPGGNRPFGWSPVPHASGKGKSLELHPEESEHLRDAVARVIAGESVRSIVARWNQRGIVTTSGSTWHGSRLTHQLRNPLLKGYRQERGELVLDDNGLPVRYYPALVDARTFEQLQEALNERASTPPGGRKSLLSGVLRCGLCDGPMSGRGTPSGPLDTYNCATRAARGPGACPGVSISQVKLDQEVAEWVTWAREDVFDILNEPDESASELSTIAEAQAQVDRWQELYAEGAVTRPKYEQKVAPLRRIIADAQETLASRPEATSALLRRALGDRDPSDAIEQFTELPRRQQRQVVASLFASIHVGPSTLPRGMKGIPRADRWKLTLNDRVTVELRSWQGEEFKPDDLRGAFVNPAASDEYLEDFQAAMEQDDRHDRRYGRD